MLATTSLELCTSWGCLLSQLQLDLEAWVNYSLETTDTVLVLDEIAEQLKATSYLLGASAYSATCDLNCKLGIAAPQNHLLTFVNVC